MKLEEKTNKEKEKKYESTGLTHQIRLTRQTWDSCHESEITNRKKLTLINKNEQKKD